MEIGVLPQTFGSKPSLSSCPGRRQSTAATSDISQAFSSTSTTAFTPALSISTKPADSKLKVRNFSILTPSQNSATSKSRTSLPSGWLHTLSCSISLPPDLLETNLQERDQVEVERWDEETVPRVNHVIIGIEAPVTSPPLIARDSMSVTNVGVGTSERNVLWQQHLNKSIAQGQHFQRRLVWGERASAAIWTEMAEPLPCPPPSEFTDAALNCTLASRPDLFQVSMLINVDHFKTLLSLAHHPNPSFVHSVCQGLREGFGPEPIPKLESI
ncbi:hypothetical protein CY34DRAFT_14697 [Suillus luteus UH-Slu-Lm8-n1]|uniref:Uncharacterized protein n=1 Tax=Suillus luteus UH-Slu-Lm8-n1 TaxID=930992 RepID=A0A0D0B551_9AGAM|nr:hypothetical protein CY34DRAFT_14697 [Suillus luteus UH-Slu-Lm8-n1]